MTPRRHPPSDGEAIDLLPDDLILHILNYVSDVKSLCRCSSVSRRFRLLVPLVSSLFIHLDCSIIISPHSYCALPPDKPTLNFSSFTVLSSVIRSLVSSILLNIPFQPLPLNYSLHPTIPSFNHRTPVHVLKNFSQLRTLHIDLPSAEISFNDSSSVTSSTLFRWRAHCGSSLNRCLILAAASSSCAAKTLGVRTGNESAVAENDTIPDSLYTDLGMAWTITSLLAASGRRCLLQPIIAGHTTLESLVLTDADGQGVLCMNRDELRELRKEPISASWEGTTIPAFRMWEWYAPLVELPCGAVLKGATLVAVLSGEKEEEEMGLGWIEEEFDGDRDGMYAEAVRLLVKGRTHYLEMDLSSFCFGTGTYKSRFQHFISSSPFDQLATHCRGSSYNNKLTPSSAVTENSGQDPPFI